MKILYSNEVLVKLLWKWSAAAMQRLQGRQFDPILKKSSSSWSSSSVWCLPTIWPNSEPKPSSARDLSSRLQFLNFRLDFCFALQQNRCRWILDFWISASLQQNRCRWISGFLPPCNRTDATEKEIERQKAAPATHPIFIILSNWNDTVMVTRCSNV